MYTYCNRFDQHVARRQLLRKDSILRNSRGTLLYGVRAATIAIQRLGKQTSKIEREFSLWSVPRLCNEAGSNTSTVTLRVVGDDENESLKSETVKYGCEYQGTQTRERLRWQRPAVYTKDRPVLSSERAPHKETRPWLSNLNKYLVMSPRWGSTPRLTDWLTDRQSQCDFNFVSALKDVTPCSPVDVHHLLPDYTVSQPTR
jgi:hypothetical protein